MQYLDPGPRIVLFEEDMTKLLNWMAEGDKAHLEMNYLLQK